MKAKVIHEAVLCLALEIRQPIPVLQSAVAFWDDLLIRKNDRLRALRWNGEDLGLKAIPTLPFEQGWIFSFADNLFVNLSSSRALDQLTFHHFPLNIHGEAADGRIGRQGEFIGAFRLLILVILEHLSDHRLSQPALYLDFDISRFDGQ